MPSIARFEDVKAWQKARELTASKYRLTRQGEFSRDYGLRDQIRRSSVSIMSNIAEGFERRGDKEFSQFLAIAKASAAEVKSQLYVACDAGFVDAEQFDHLARMAEETIRMIGGTACYLPFIFPLRSCAIKYVHGPI